MTQYRVDTHEFWGTNKTIYEVVMLADQYGNRVSSGNPSGMAVDGFGRARTSTPLTLFDSSHRYDDNQLWATSNSAAGNSTVTFSANQGLILLAVSNAANAEIIRETSRVFSYQPGKSLQTFNTFVFNASQTNLRQRVGFFGAQNGIYLELSDDVLYFVRRYYNLGSVQEERIAQTSWNVDKLNGVGPSKITLDISAAQIFFIDVEWLGVGSVRCGFVIDGQFIHCHSFHHANESGSNSTYMTTATLPLRYEIKNTAATGNSSVLKQICSTVISEGGYELRGRQFSMNTSVTSAYDLTNAGQYYPVIALRLANTRLDAAAVLSGLSVLGIGNNGVYHWKVVIGGTVTEPGSPTGWVAVANSSMEYKMDGTAFTGGRTVISGFIGSSTQSSVPVSLPRGDLFKFQFERNGLTNTADPIILAVASKTAGDDVFATLDWEEVSR